MKTNTGSGRGAPFEAAMSEARRHIDLHWRNTHWPAFNLADVFIVGSAGLLVLASFGREGTTER